MDAFVGCFVGAFVEVLEGLKTGKSTLVGPAVGVLVGDLVGPLVGPLVVPLVDPLMGRGSFSPALCVAHCVGRYANTSLTPSIFLNFVVASKSLIASQDDFKTLSQYTFLAPPFC